MPSLVDDIGNLRDRALMELTAAHEYYTDSQVAWRIIQEEIESGRKIIVENITTKSVTTETMLASKARGYVVRQLAEATFQQFISIFENFFFDLLRLWLVAHPQSLGGKQLSFKIVLDSLDKEAVIDHVAAKELNELTYERPKEWFRYLEGRMKLGTPSDAEIDRFGEAKASRDILAHNRGIANELYKSRAGKLARFETGEKLEIPEVYHRETWELLRELIADLADAAAAKTI